MMDEGFFFLSFIFNLDRIETLVNIFNRPRGLSDRNTDAIVLQTHVFPRSGKVGDPVVQLLITENGVAIPRL